MIEARAARRAIADATVPDTCSGAISPDTIYPCSTPDPSGTDTFTVTLANPADRVLIRVLQASSFGPASLPITVTAPDGSTVTCQAPIQLYACATSQAGTYSIAVQNEGSSYTIAYTALLAEPACPPVSLSFAAAPVQDSAAAGTTGNCYSLNVPSGHVLHEDFTTQPNAVSVGVYDATGGQVCDTVRGDCALTGTAPYRVFVSSFFGEAEAYTLELNDISQPAGCATATQLTYGQVPALAAGLCQALTVAAAGSYQLSAAAPGNPNVQGSLYDSTATVACSVNGSSPASCSLAAGTYNFIASGDYPPLMSFGVSLIAASESRGCTATSDTGFASGAAQGTFAGAGEEICLTLPTAPGKTDYFFNLPTADGSTSQVQVMDATGAQQCGSSLQFGFATCTLSGTAPFRVILYGHSANGGYRYLTQRSDSTAGCTAWPQSAFGDAFGATATLAFNDDVKCLVIPATQHSAGEMIDYANPANTANAAIYVNDPTGKQVCVGNSTAICAYQPGVTYTALLITVAAKGDTYHLVRRDVSKTAACATPASTTPGGASTTFTLTSALDTRCYRVTAATADKLWFSARALAPTPPSPRSSAGAVLQVTDPNGAGLCREFGTLACKLSGSAEYQLIVSADNYAGVAITTHLDTWRVGNASGWAPECAAHHFTAGNGFPFVSGTLTEQAAGYCAVIDTQQFQSFDIPGATTSGYPDVEDLNVWAPGYWTTSPPVGLGLCSGNFGTFGATCAAIQTGTFGSDLLVLDLGTAQGGTGYGMQGICKTECAAPRQQATLTSVSPASQPAQAGNKLVITGANLSLGTQVTLASNGVNQVTGSPLAANSTGSSLTVAFDTSGLTPGHYDVVLDNPGYTVGTPSPGYLPNAYTATTAPPAPAPKWFTAVNPARILDTRTGLGAAKAKVKAHATLTLTVAGKGGVPASNVSAVAVDVTAISPAAAGYLTAYPAGTARPGVSDLTFAATQTVTNLIIVSVSGGKVAIFNNSGGPLDLTGDVVGYYAPGNSGAKLTTVSPGRLLNTLTGTGAAKAHVPAHGTVALTVAGRLGIPATGVTAVALNVTALSPKAAGALTVYPNGTGRPPATSLSFAAGQTVASEVIVRLVNGKASLYNNSAGTVDLYADAVGYFSSANGSTFLAVGPQRVLDTRSGLGGSGQAVLRHAAAVTPITDIPALAGANVTAVALEVTVTGAQQAGSLTVFPDFTNLPGAPAMRFAASRTVTGLVIVPVVNGDIDFYNNSAGDIQVLADLAGYYTG